MRFGKILPYLHVYGENNQIKEYEINPNPENKERDWIIPYSDDCDLGEDAWLSYDEGESGKAFGILFSSNSVNYSPVNLTTNSVGHKYDLEKYGLTEEQIRKDYAPFYDLILNR